MTGVWDVTFFLRVGTAQESESRLKLSSGLRPRPPPLFSRATIFQDVSRPKSLFTWRSLIPVDSTKSAILIGNARLPHSPDVCQHKVRRHTAIVSAIETHEGEALQASRLICSVDVDAHLLAWVLSMRNVTWPDWLLTYSTCAPEPLSELKVACRILSMAVDQFARLHRQDRG